MLCLKSKPHHGTVMGMNFLMARGIVMKNPEKHELGMGQEYKKKNSDLFLKYLDIGISGCSKEVTWGWNHKSIYIRKQWLYGTCSLKAGDRNQFEGFWELHWGALRVLFIGTKKVPGSRWVRQDKSVLLQGWGFWSPGTERGCPACLVRKTEGKHRLSWHMGVLFLVPDLLL